VDRFGIVGRGIMRQTTLVERAVRTALAVIVPTALRWMIDGGAYGTTLTIYLPAILMISVYLGRGWGLAAMAGSVAAMIFVLPAQMIDVRPGVYAVAILLFVGSAMVMVVVGDALRIAVLAFRERTRQAEDFNRELQHRTKNSLQMIRALASRATKATDPGAFYEALSGRLEALAKANELLRFGALETCDLRELVEAAIKPFETRQIVVDGPDLSVSREACVPLIMGLHELSTNATKHGALSCEEGRVAIHWDRGRAADEIELEWVESGGPPVQQPKSKGLGTRLLVPNGGMKSVSMQFRPEGLLCRITVSR
jgi:two-component sensor histidine kinase